MTVARRVFVPVEALKVGDRVEVNFHDGSTHVTTVGTVRSVGPMWTTPGIAVTVEYEWQGKTRQDVERFGEHPILPVATVEED